MHTTEGSELVDRPADPGAPPQAPPIQVRNIAFVLLSIAIVLLLLQFMQPVLLPIVLGALLFYALDPAVDRMQTLHVPRALGAALMLFIVVTSCRVLAYTLQGQALRVVDQPPVFVGLLFWSWVWGDVDLIGRITGSRESFSFV